MISSGAKRTHDGRDDLVEREPVAGVRGRGRERHIDRASVRAGPSGRTQRSCVGGVPVLLVQGDREDLVAVPEDTLGAVCDVHVPVDDRHALNTTGAGVLHSARQIVQVGRGDCPIGLGMVPGRSSVHQRPLDAAVEDRVDGGQHAADGQPCRLPGGRRHRCVLAVPRATRAGRAQTVEVLGRMNREQRLVGRWSGRDTGERAAQRAALDELVRLSGERSLGHVRATQREAPARDLHRRGRWIVGENLRRVHVAQHNATMLTRAPREPEPTTAAWPVGVRLPVPASPSASPTARSGPQTAICVVASAFGAAREYSSAGSSIGARRTRLRSRT